MLSRQDRHLKRLTMDGTVWGSNSGEDEFFRTHPDRLCIPPSFLYSEYRVSFPGVKRPVRGISHLSPHRAEVNERVDLTSTPPLGLSNLF
jgi:hypothetical protein